MGRLVLRTSVVPSNQITQSVVLHYVNPTTGAVTTTTVTSGVTSITIDRYQKVYMDCSGTRSVEEDGDSEGEAWASIGHRVNWGESLGSTWAYPEGASYSNDEDIGTACFARVFTTTGSKTVRVKSKDSANNEATTTFTVVVNALAAATNIPVSGAWPTINDDTVYSLDGGGDYQAKSGTLNLDGKKNVVFIKTGGGADPRLNQVYFDSRNNEDSAMTRSSNIRFVNCDINLLGWGAVGHDFCGAVGGRVRSLNPEPSGYYYREAIKNGTGSTRAGNHRYSMGWFLWNTGELNDMGGGTQEYCYIGSANYASFHGVDMNRTYTDGGSAEHVLRPYIPYLVSRYNRLRGTGITIASWLKGSSLPCSYSQTPDLPVTTAIGVYADDRTIWTTWSGTYPDAGGDILTVGYGYPARNCVFERNQFGASGSTPPSSGGIGYGPQNNDVQAAWPPSRSDHSNEGFENCSIQHNWVYGTPSGISIQITGRHMVARNNIDNMGAGSNISVTTNAGPNRTPSGWNAPYYTTGSQPVPSSF